MYILYSYYRSSCSWRVRLALELKGLPYEIKTINLLKDDQSSCEYLKINPSGCVPAMMVADEVLTQSSAILEYLDEAHSDSALALMPSNLMARAKVRRLMQIIVADCQPLQNLQVLRKVAEFAAKSDEEVRTQWGAHYIRKALTAFDALIAKETDTYSCGDSVTLADVCLIPQLYNAARFGVNVQQEYPGLAAIEAAFKAQHPEAYNHAHPDNQPQ